MRKKWVGLGGNTIETEIANGSHAAEMAVIPHIAMISENTGLPCALSRKQKPIQPAFRMTIDRSQGQTLRYVGIYLPCPVSSHGQLYMAMSRASDVRNIKIIAEWDMQGIPMTMFIAKP
jgi:hypothetical protein